MAIFPETGGGGGGGMALTSDNPTLDPYFRSRMSEPHALFESDPLYGLEPLLWNQLVAGAGAVNFTAGQSKVLLSVGTGAADRAVRQSKSYLPHDPGRGQLLIAEGVLGPSTEFINSRIGYFDDANGVFFQLSGPSLAPVELASDAFPGIALSANWTNQPAGGGSVAVNNGAAWSTGPLNTHGIAYYTGVAFPPNQYSEVVYSPTLGTNFETDVFGPTVHMTAAGGYWAVFYSDEWFLWAINPDGTLHHQIAITGGRLNGGDVVRLTIVGTLLILTQNGKLILQAVDPQNTFTSGSPGLCGYNQSANPTQAQAQTIQSWNGGNAGLPGGLMVVERTTVGGVTLDTGVTQDLWNLDKLDGTGASGQMINPTLGQMFVIDLQSAAVGRIRFGVDFGSGPVYCHEFVNNNNSLALYMQTSCLPVRYEIVNEGAPTAGATLVQLASSVVVEGESGRKKPALQFTANNGTTVIAVTTLRPVLSIEPALTFGGFRNQIRNLLRRLTINTASAGVFWQLVYNGTLTGATFNPVDAVNSGMKFDVAATAISGGVVVESGYIPVGGDTVDFDDAPWVEKLPFTLDFAGAKGDIFTVMAASLGGGATNVLAALDWLEQH